LPSLALELASPRAAPAGPLQAATLPLSRRSRWPSFLPGRLPLRPPSPSAGIQLQLLLATASPPSPLLSCQSALRSFRADAADRIYVGVAVAAVPVPRQLRHPPLPPAARARRRAGAGAASLPVADQPHASLQPQRPPLAVRRRARRRHGAALADLGGGGGSSSASVSSAAASLSSAQLLTVSSASQSWIRTPAGKDDGFFSPRAALLTQEPTSKWNAFTSKIKGHNKNRPEYKQQGKQSSKRMRG